MGKKNLKMLMVAIVLIPIALTAYLAKTLYERQGVPQAVESLAKQLFKSKEEERQATEQVRELEKKTEELKTAYDSLLAELQGEVDSKDVRIRRFREKIEINFVDKVLFVSGSAEITPRGQSILGKVGQVLKKVKDRRFFVVGHTDDVPIRSFVFPSNWELSTARASSVIRYVSERHGVDPAQFTAMGRAFYQPVASNETPEGRQENRRVEIIIADLPLFEVEGGEMRSPASSPDGKPSSAEPLESTAPRERDLTLPEADLPKGQAPAAPSAGPASDAAPATPDVPAAPAAEATPPAAAPAPEAATPPADTPTPPQAPEAPATPSLPSPPPAAPAS
ncbi:OmpA family protein [Desulfovibrio sulfodismutans]|uniref:OmpA family protein n=1 Tax=Desulfolutivibrio sulfodismutans TaxID=63561 RepID=A0A7K3NME0_9BACT|nr:OmpA family protein [Desulfolutivibrio sulfodismutans]NDY57361.1 OmpA family protein [Desulfolutivibrio sulfodismutans]QLA12458.1 OmpA family protein [Desulfolutivibrio sulfodismutans DSM 3696]